MAGTPIAALQSTAVVGLFTGELDLFALGDRQPILTSVDFRARNAGLRGIR